MKCLNCNKENKNDSKFCIYCGNPLSNDQDNNIVDFTKMGLEYYYLLNDTSEIIDTIITEELTKNKCNIKDSTTKLNKNKLILTAIYSVILFICLSLYFFHSHRIILFIVFLIITKIYFSMLKKYNLFGYLKKQILARPDEKISYIVSSILEGKDNSSSFKIIRCCLLIIPFILCLFIFNSPRVIYEKTDDSYVVRFYTLGILKKDKTLEIPSTYKDKPVIGIRGDVFRNVRTIENVILPDTIEEIRGGAFMNSTNLKEINLPKGLTEIKGSTFEGCSSLNNIVIPEGVTRIGGSAFRDCYNLDNVIIPKSVLEIGSSAFRNTALREVCVSNNADINFRAFKDTYSNIYYYENGCKNDYSGEYNE